MTWRSVGLTINTWIERLIFVWLLCAMALGYLFSNVFAGGKGAVVVLFAFMTFATAMGTRAKDFFQLVRSPWMFLLMFVCSHVVMPVVALGVGTVLFHTHADVVGLVLLSSIPIAVTSVMWVGMAGGNSPLALSAVSFDTLLSPVVIPATVFLLLHNQVSLPFLTLFVGLVWMVVLPTLFGVAVEYVSKGKAKPLLQPVVGPLSKLSMLAVVTINVAVATPFMRGQLSRFTGVLVVLAIMAMVGFLVGYVASRLARRSQPDTVTMTYSIGMRNISAGVTIAGTYFGHAVALPVILGMLFQQPLATAVFWLLRRRAHHQSVERIVQSGQC